MLSRLEWSFVLVEINPITRPSTRSMMKIIGPRASQCDDPNWWCLETFRLAEEETLLTFQQSVREQKFCSPAATYKEPLKHR